MATENGLAISWNPIGKSGRVALAVRQAGDTFAVEKVDLLTPEKRSDFVKQLCQQCPGINPIALEEELLAAAGELSELLANRNGKKLEAEPAAVDVADELLAKMPEAVRDEARGMLESRDLMERVVTDIAAAGVAGERGLAATIYLVATSRLLDRPLAAIVQGPSSSGKSFVIEKVASLFPKETTLLATQMTPQALFHMKPGSLVHRFIVAGERSRLEEGSDEKTEATRALREMISSGRLVKLMPTKIGSEIQTVQITQEGPIAFVESTTLGRIFDEDANRCLLLATDETDKQTRRIIEATSAGYSGASRRGDVARIVEKHHALQRMLRPFAVVVPFAPRLGELLSDRRVEVRRAFPQIVGMAQTSCLLHQRQRQEDGDGRLLANRDDYSIARHLLFGPMSRLLGGAISEAAQRFFDRLTGWHEAGRFKHSEGRFTAAEIRRLQIGCKNSIYSWLADLETAGLVEIVETHQGRKPTAWRLLDEDQRTDSDADGGVLPTVDEVFRV